MAQPLQIVIASDRTFERLGLRYALKAVENIEITEINTAEEWLQLPSRSCIPIVITNLWDRLPAGKNKLPRPFVLIALIDEYKEHSIDRMKSAGAKGFILSGASAGELAEAIHSVSNGGEYYCRAIQEKMEEEQRYYNRAGMKKVKLTRTELMVMKYTLEELSDKEIAAKMDRSTRTIETHKRNIREKTKTHSNFSCINFMKQRGILIWHGIAFLIQFLSEGGFVGECI
jgi:DNA-binding NarL/FixJ family response regulator